MNYNETSVFIGSRREVLWDDALVETSETTAELRVMHPVRREPVLVHDAPWEGDGCDYYNIVADDGLYRMYYLAWKMLDPAVTTHTVDRIRVAYAESRDGIRWEKPDLGLCAYNGSTKNNILLDDNFLDGSSFDNFFVFKDTNPACTDGERYKALFAWKGALWYALADDGIHFRRVAPITDKGFFDTLNTCHWDPYRKQYRLYVRSFHDYPEGDLNAGIRDIRVLTSRDFVSWTGPEPLEYPGSPDVPLYTNVVMPYYRADHMLVGFPTRYVERRSWTQNFDRLCGAERRKQRAAIHPRYGLTTTDCVFMCSRDGKVWTRNDEAFIRPGKENPYSWVYGDAYPTYGMIETPSDFPGEEQDLSMFVNVKHWSQEPAVLYRFTIRPDGFVSRHAGFEPKTLLTKPFVFKGERLYLNFETSALGYLFAEMTDKNGRPLEGYRSCELFGNALDRKVDFADDLKKLEGRAVRLRFTFSDADLYAYRFGEET